MIRDRTSLGWGLQHQLWAHFDNVGQAYRLNVIANVVDCKGFIFCSVLSLQIRTIGIYDQHQLTNWEKTDLCLLDEKVEGTDTTTITSRHSIDLIHDETCACTNSNAGNRCALSVSSDAQGEIYKQLTCRPVPLKKPSKEALSILVEFYLSAKTKLVGMTHLY
jgi:hypothetical protein